MIINFVDIAFKQLPDGDNGMSLCLTSNDHTLSVPTERQSVSIDTNNLTAGELNILSNFITMVKSKLQSN